MAENRLDEAQALLQKYARINGADVESKTLRDNNGASEESEYDEDGEKQKEV